MDELQNKLLELMVLLYNLIDKEKNIPPEMKFICEDRSTI